MSRPSQRMLLIYRSPVAFSFSTASGQFLFSLLRRHFCGFHFGSYLVVFVLPHLGAPLGAILLRRQFAFSLKSYSPHHITTADGWPGKSMLRAPSWSLHLLPLLGFPPARAPEPASSRFFSSGNDNTVSLNENRAAQWLLVR